MTSPSARGAPAEPHGGQLRLILGAAPGTGATFAMLSEARRRRDRGATVRIAALDPRGRPATVKLALDLDAMSGPPIGELEPLLAATPDVVLVDDVATTDAQPTLARSASVEVRDGSLTLEVGGRSQRTGDFAYTFVAFLDITPE